MKAKTKKTVSKKTATKTVKPIKVVAETMHSLRCNALKALGIDPNDKASMRQVIAGGPKAPAPIGRPRANVITLANGKKAA
jgi:hypothetical protein